MVQRIIIERVVVVDPAENITINTVVKEEGIIRNRLIIPPLVGEQAAVAIVINIISLQTMKATMRKRD